MFETNRSLVAESTNTTAIKLLSPYDRILQPTAAEIPFFEYLNAKFRALHSQRIAHSSRGTQTTSPSNPKLKWLDIEFGAPDTFNKVFWDIYRGLYN